MKRLMTLFLALLTVMTVCAFPLAAEAYDSLELSPEEAEMAYETFHIAPGTPITRIYSLSLWSIEFISISDMLEDEFFPKYMTKDAVYTICDGYWTKSPVGDFGFFRLAESPEKVLGPEAKVERVYCADGTVHEGQFIHFFTDNGDFVLYHCLQTEKFYLFPGEYVKTLAHEKWSWHFAHPDAAMTPLEKMVDSEMLEPYRIADPIIPEDPPVETETPATETPATETREPDVETPIVTYTPPEETVTPPDETVPQPYETVTPAGETVAPSGTPGNATETPAPTVPESKDTPKGGKTVPIICASAAAAVLIAAGAVFFALRAKKKKGQ